jgi:hypothetical protein
MPPLAGPQREDIVLRMYPLAAFFLFFVSLLPACSSADGDVRPHASDQQEEATMRAQLAQEVQRRVRLTAVETGVADLDDSIVAAIAEVPR